MMKTKNRLCLLLLPVLTICTPQIDALDYTSVETALSEAFTSLTDDNEGTTSFRSLLIPAGGRAESLGTAYTGLSDDISYLEYNPSASSIMKYTECSVFHNAWIADSAMETLSFTTRFNHLGLGAAVKCFYVPFTEYNSFGERTAGNYYTETTGIFNISYNFLAGYTFKGIALGANLKAAWRGVPDYTDDDSGNIIADSGISQSALAVMGDAGLMLQFNLGKFYTSRDANFRVGLNMLNAGAAFTGFKSENGVTLDDPLPSSFALGVSYKMIRPVTLTAEFRQPVNLIDMSEHELFSAGTGVEVSVTSFFSVLGGFQLKGGNPRISLGSEFEVKKVRMNVNYTLDLTSSLNPVNHISLSAKLELGDRGRAEKQKEIDDLYTIGLDYFAKGDFTNAITVWKQVLDLDSRFDPAIDGIKSAQNQLNLFQRIRDSQFLD